jgi:hypothetical protein
MIDGGLRLVCRRLYIKIPFLQLFNIIVLTALSKVLMCSIF